MPRRGFPPGQTRRETPKAIASKPFPFLTTVVAGLDGQLSACFHWAKAQNLAETSQRGNQPHNTNTTELTEYPYPYRGTRRCQLGVVAGVSQTPASNHPHPGLDFMTPGRLAYQVITATSLV